jgi:hypothetical protein
MSTSVRVSFWVLLAALSAAVVALRISNLMVETTISCPEAGGPK